VVSVSVLFCFFFKIYLFERKSVSECIGGGEAEGEGEKESQVDSLLIAEPD